MFEKTGTTSTIYIVPNSHDLTVSGDPLGQMAGRGPQRGEFPASNSRVTPTWSKEERSDLIDLLDASQVSMRCNSRCFAGRNLLSFGEPQIKG